MKYFAIMWLATWVVIGGAAWAYFGSFWMGLMSVWAPIVVGIWFFRRQSDAI